MRFLRSSSYSPSRRFLILIVIIALLRRCLVLFTRLRSIPLRRNLFFENLILRCGGNVIPSSALERIHSHTHTHADPLINQRFTRVGSRKSTTRRTKRRRCRSGRGAPPTSDGFRLRDDAATGRKNAGLIVAVRRSMGRWVAQAICQRVARDQRSTETPSKEPRKDTGKELEDRERRGGALLSTAFLRQIVGEADCAEASELCLSCLAGSRRRTRSNRRRKETWSVGLCVRLTVRSCR